MSPIRPRRRATIEPLEPRTFLSLSPTPDAYSLLEDSPLTVSLTPLSLRLSGDNNLYTGNHTFTADQGAFTAEFQDQSDIVVIHYTDPDETIELDFAPPVGQALTVGTTYSPADRALSAARPAFDVVYNSQHYSPNPLVVGTFTVLQLHTAGDTLTRFAADFSLSTGLTGWIRYNYDPGLLGNDGAGSFTASLAAPPSHGDVSLNPNGTFTYTPHPDFHGTDSFSYTASDGSTTSAPIPVTLTVNPTNDAPTLSLPPTLTVAEDAGPLSFPNFATPSPGPGESDEFVSVTLAEYSNSPLFSVPPSIDSTGRLTFTPAPNAHGTSTLTFFATDSFGIHSNNVSLTLTVTSTPDAPTPSPDHYDLFANLPFTPDPTTPLTLLYINDPATGAQYLLTPANSTPFFFPTSFGYINSSFAPTSPSLPTWRLSLGGPNASTPFPGTYNNASNHVPSPILAVYTDSLPTSTAGSFTVHSYSSDSTDHFSADFTQYTNGSSSPLTGSLRYNVIQGSLLSNDTPDSPFPLTAQLLSNPSHGTLTLSPDGLFTYTPHPGFAGTDTFTYRPITGPLAGAPTTVTLNVLPDLASTLARGSLLNLYPGPDGSPVTTPLASRTIYQDINNNNSLDPNEPSTLTSLDGLFELPLTGTGSHTLRTVPLPGWSTPAGYDSYLSINLTPSSPATTDAASLYTSMSNPIIIDVATIVPAGVNPLLIPAYFRTANQVFANSDANLRLNLVAALPTDYLPTGDIRIDLTRLASPRDGHLDSALSQRDQLSADLAILFLPSPTGENVGLGYVLDPGNPNPAAGFAAVALTGHDQFDGFTLAHEIGHTLGADHDPDNGPVSPLYYAQGHRFTGNDSVLYRDIMAYAPGQQLPFFSTPLLSYAGQPLGTPAADNTRVLRQYAYLVASYRGPKWLPPASNPPLPTLTTLSVTTTKLPTKPGTPITATTKVRNNSKKPFTGTLTVAFYLSTDKILDAKDTLLKRNTLQAKNLKPNSTLSTSITVTLSPRLKPRTYYLLSVTTPTGKPPAERAAPTTSTPLKIISPPKKPTKKPLSTPFQTTLTIQ